MLNWDEYGKEENNTPIEAVTAQKEAVPTPVSQEAAPVVETVTPSEEVDNTTSCLLYTSPSPRD